MELSKTAKLNPRAEEPRVFTVVPTPLCSNVSANLVDLFVTTDSVVATAKVETTRSSSRIEVYWDDGQTDVLKLPPGVLFDQPLEILGQDDLLPKGTYQFSHTYNVSEDGKPFRKLVQVTVDSKNEPTDFRVQEIFLTPRYKINYYESTVYVKDDFDFLEGSQNFDIYQRIDGELVGHWKWKPGKNLGSEFGLRLEGSAISRELTVDDWVNISYRIIEHDTLSQNDVVNISVYMHPDLNEDGNVPVDKTGTDVGGELGDNTAGIRFQRSIQLIASQPNSSTVFASKV